MAFSVWRQDLSATYSADRELVPLITRGERAKVHRTIRCTIPPRGTGLPMGLSQIFSLNSLMLPCAARSPRCVRSALVKEEERREEVFYNLFHITVILDKSMPVLFSRPFLFQTFTPTLNQMHVVVFSKSVLHVGNPLYPPDIPFSTYILYSVCCPPVGPQDIKHKRLSIFHISSTMLKCSLLEMHCSSRHMLAKAICCNLHIYGVYGVTTVL